MNKTVENTEPTIRVLAMPADTNASGDIFGGWLMSQADIAGSILAYQEAQGRVVTIAVNEFLFLKPVFVGDLVSFYTSVKRIGNTSITIDVKAYAARGRESVDSELVADADITYVAIDTHRNPRKINN